MIFGISDENRAKLLLLDIRFRFFSITTNGRLIRANWFVTRDSDYLRERPKDANGMWAVPRMIKTPANFVEAAIRWAGQDDYWY